MFFIVIDEYIQFWAKFIDFTNSFHRPQFLISIFKFPTMNGYDLINSNNLKADNIRKLPLLR